MQCNQSQLRVSHSEYTVRIYQITFRIFKMVGQRVKQTLALVTFPILMTMYVLNQSARTYNEIQVNFAVSRHSSLINSDSNINNEISNIKIKHKRHILAEMLNETKQELLNTVNVHYWDYCCGYSVESFRSHPLFPFFPFRRELENELNITKRGIHFGARIFGFIHPYVTGHYKFAISSDDSSQFWLSPGIDPLNVELLAHLGGQDGKQWAYSRQYDKYPNQVSPTLSLKSGTKYFFEVLWKQESGRGHLELAWKKPNSNRFEVITSKHISRYYDDDLMQDGIVYLHHIKHDVRMRDSPSHIKQIEKDKQAWLKKRSSPYQRDSSEFLSLPIIPFKDISDVLPTCEYEPTYLVLTEEQKKELPEGQYRGVHLPHYFNISTKVYPPDSTWDFTKECIGVSLKPMHCQGNEYLDEKTANWITNTFMRLLDRKFKRRYTLHTIVNVEENDGDNNGVRYLLEVALKDTLLNKMVRLSVYLYKSKFNKGICYPKDFQWNPDAMVYLTLTVKNQGPWVYQYIESLSKIFVYTNDSRFSLLITDFDSYDIKLEKVLQRSSLPNWKVIRKKGKFHKTFAIQEAVATINDPNGIIMQTDLHLEFPLNFIDDVRKHSVQGKMGYTPLLLRLACGCFLHKPAGFWEAFGYGVFSTYKSDWDGFGGMDVEKFRNAWGGEDWDFAERVIKAGLEIERLRLPYFFHYFHTKKGMWDGNAKL